MDKKVHQSEKDNPEKDLGRRGFLKTTGAVALLSGSGITGSASASSDVSTSAAAAGVSEEISQNVSSGNMKRARRLAEKHNVEYTFGKKQFTADQSGDGVQTEDIISREGLTLYFFVYKARTENGDQIYAAVTSLEVEPSNNWILDNGAPHDLFVLNWSDTYWQPDSQSIKNYSQNGNDQQALDFNLYNRYSVQSKLYDMEFRDFGDDKHTVGFETELEKLATDNEYNITAQFLHTWNIEGAYYLDSFTFGPANFKLNGFGVKRWNAPLAITKKK